MATSGTVVFGRDELDLIVAFSGCSLDESPGSNWVQDNGGLPDYICRIAKAVKKTGKTTSEAIAIAVSRVKKWASGVGVNKDTQAKAAAAVAEWEKLRTKSNAKSAADKVKASRSSDNILVLSDAVTSFNVDNVRAAWRRQNSPVSPYTEAMPYKPFPYIMQLWTDYIIVSGDLDNDGDDDDIFRVDYTVDGDGNVTFEDPVEVKVQYVAVKSAEMVGASMTDAELHRLVAATPPCNGRAVDKVLLSISSKPSALETVLNFGG